MIHFSKSEDYAVIFLSVLAKHYNQRLVPLSEIAQTYNIPILFLRNLVNKLRNAQIVTAVEGKSGGYTLAKAPDQIKMIEVLKLFSKKPLVAHCATEKQCQCGDTDICHVGSTWRKLNQEFIEKIANLSLSDFSHYQVTK